MSNREIKELNIQKVTCPTKENTARTYLHADDPDSEKYQFVKARNKVIKMLQFSPPTFSRGIMN